jgi:hypothetical protein
VHKERRYAALLALLVLMLLISPTIHIIEAGIPIFWALLGGIFFAVSYVIYEQRMLLGLIAALGLVSSAGGLASRYIGVLDAELTGGLVLILLFGGLTLLVLDDLKKSSIVTVQTLNGGICGYLLIGYTFAAICNALSIVLPGSFLTFSGLDLDTSQSFAVFIYYSLATMTTVGSQQVYPATDAASAVTSLLAVVGVLYVAVLISRLVAGVERQRRENSNAGGQLTEGTGKEVTDIPEAEPLSEDRL